MKLSRCLCCSTLSEDENDSTKPRRPIEASSQAPARDLACWMTLLPDECLISSLYLAGSHESTSFYGLASVCQSRSLTWQLTHGIRFIDIRFALIKGQLQAYHGPVNQRRTAAELFHEVYAFLDAHPSEMLLCSIKQRKENAAVPLFEELMIQLILLDPKRWFLEDRFPILGEARGKIILFSRYGRGANLGIHPSNWPDNVKRVFSSLAGGLELYTQDWYFPAELLAIPEKFALIIQLHQLRPPAPAFRLNFCNAASFLSGFPSTVALGIGFSFFGIEGINSRLLHFLQHARKEREPDEAGQAFMLDFCDQPAGLIDLIVSFNFRPKEDQSMGRSAEKKGSLV